MYDGVLRNATQAAAAAGLRGCNNLSPSIALPFDCFFT